MNCLIYPILNFFIRYKFIIIDIDSEDINQLIKTEDNLEEK
jgi:hypothetical protein